jgi:N-acyl homoserine lactone hydrolase
MPRQAKVVATFVLVAFSLMVEAMPDASAGSTLPDAIQAGVAEKLFRLDCGRSLANDESVWTPGENVGRSIEFSCGMPEFPSPRTTTPEVGLPCPN